jgi:hypothetical protein
MKKKCTTHITLQQKELDDTGVKISGYMRTAAGAERQNYITDTHVQKNKLKLLKI